MTDYRIQDALVQARERAAARVTELGGLRPTPPYPLAPTASLPAISEGEVARIISTLLPGLIASIQQARTALGDRRLSLAETLALGTSVVALVSRAVNEVPRIQGQDARVLALAVGGALYDLFVAPELPALLKPFSAAFKSLALAGLEAAYQALVKKK